MKKLLFVLSMLLFFVIAQQGLAGDAIFDDSSKTLTISNVKFGNDPSLYNVKLQLKSDGDLSLLALEELSDQTNESNDGIDFLYNVNPFLLSYKMYSNSHGRPVSELGPIQSVSESTKWNREDVIGVYTDAAQRKFTFYEDGTGMLTCPDGEISSTTICQEVSAFEWTIDSYGNLAFGVFIHYSALDIYYRFIWALVDSDDDNITIYAQELRIANNSLLTLSEGIRSNITKE